MSSGDQGLKTKHEVLKEYEKSYLARLEEKAEPEEKLIEEPKVESNISLNLQDLIFNLSAKFETNVNKEYIGHCVACLKKVERNKMVYKNNHLFHASCFEQHGNDYQATTNLMNEERRDRVDLAYLKNLKVRSDGSVGEKPPNKKKSTRKTKKKAKRRKISRKKETKTKRKTRAKKRIVKRKVRRSKPKRRKASSKKRKFSRKRTVRKRGSKRRTSRKKVRRRSSGRKTKRRR